MEELVRTGKVVKEEAEQSDHERVEETMEELAWTEKEVEEETKKSNEERVEEKNNAIKQLFEPEINARSISIATVREEYARIQFNATKMQRRCTTKYGRAQWRYKAKVDNMSSTVILAPEKESVADRIDRMLNESNS